MMTRQPQRVAILGSTGSIGVSTLDVIARHRGRFEVSVLSAKNRVEALRDQCLAWRPRYAVAGDATQAKWLRDRLAAADVATDVLHGPRALEELAAHPDVDCVMAAVVGVAGLLPSLAAARAGKRLLLANKEALVVGGALFMRAVRDGGASLLPIDSEHSAIFQCLPADRSAWPACIERIVLTASGGPFRARDPQSLAAVTPDEACAHPNFSMGRKISVDSATMMNKALEVIEARWLFDLEPRQIEVVIHPQQIVHSMVVCRDHSVLAQLGTPDMRVPIAYGLAHPERIESGASRLDFASLGALAFEAPDAKLHPGLALAWQTLDAPAGTSAVLNAANEEAVAAFLARTIGFHLIHRLNCALLDAVRPEAGECATIDGLLALDARTRRAAARLIRELA